MENLIKFELSDFWSLNQKSGPLILTQKVFQINSTSQFPTLNPMSHNLVIDCPPAAHASHNSQSIEFHPQIPEPSSGHRGPCCCPTNTIITPLQGSIDVDGRRGRWYVTENWSLRGFASHFGRERPFTFTFCLLFRVFFLFFSTKMALNQSPKLPMREEK